MFNKIRFENKINTKMWGSFEILESYVGERVNKIKFVGSIDRSLASAPNTIEVVKYRSHEDCF